MTLDTITSADWQPLLNQSFTLQVDAQAEPQSVVLIEVTELGATTAAPEAGRSPFSLVFRDAHGGYLPQSIYTLEHDQLGHLDIFLVPIGRDAAGTRYEAIFN